jgi:tetratricopeptide (TPR) repeat protein
VTSAAVNHSMPLGCYCDARGDRFLVPTGSNSQLDGMATMGRLGTWYWGSMAGVSALTAAALVVTSDRLPLGSPSRRALADLVMAVDRPAREALPPSMPAARTVTSRLSTRFRWAAPPAAARGTREGEAITPSVAIAAGRIEQHVLRERNALTLQAYATAQLVLGRPSLALTAIEEAVRLAPDVPGMWVDLAAASYEHAERAGEAIFLPKALEAANTAIALQASDPAAWFNKALILERLNIRGQAAAAWTQFLVIERHPRWVAEAKQRLAALRTRETESRITDTQPVHDALLDATLARWAEAVMGGDRATVDAAIGETRRAVASLEALSTDRWAADVLRQVEDSKDGDRKELARGFAAYGAARRHYRADDYERAAPLFATAAAVMDGAGSPAVHMARLHQGILLYRRGAHADAIATLRAVRATAADRGYYSIAGRASWVEGLALEVSGFARLATPRYDEAIRDLRLGGEIGNASFVLGLLASQYDRLGSPERAWQAWLGALAGATREGPLITASISASQLGWNRAALDLQRGAIALARAAKRSTTLADGLRWYAITSARLGLIDEARSALTEARATAQGQSGAAWNRIRAEIDLAEAVSDGLSSPTARIDAATRALAYFEATGAVGRLPELLLARATVRKGTGQTDLGYEDLKHGIRVLSGLRENVAAGVDQMTFADIVRRLVSAFIELADSRGQMREAFDAVEDARARDLPHGATNVSLGALEAAMPPGVALIQFVVGDVRSYAWMVRQGTSSWRRIDAGRARLSELVQAMGAPRWDRTAAAQLRELIFGDTIRPLGKDTLLVIVPDGPLHLAPFAMFAGEAATYLIEEFPILIAPSARSWLAASAQLNQYRALPSRAFVAGNPRIDRQRYGELPDLPHAEQEARTVAALYGVAPVLGSHVTREVVVRAFDTEVVHFGGHALVNDARPSESALVVWDPGGPGLSAAAIRASHCERTRLIVLAACRSASGQMTRTEGPIGLARAFLAAGGPSVVASQWEVDDRPSSALFRRFHEAYLETGNPAAALRIAQTSMIRSGEPVLRDPRSWAGFVAFGGAPFAPARP